jgi:hypothetical protein
VIRRSGLSVPGNGVEIRIANVLPNISMDLIGAGLDAGAHHRTGRVAELGTEVTGLKVELGESIGRRAHHEAGAVEKVDQVCIVVDAVENEVVLFCALSIGYEIAGPASARPSAVS